MSERSNGILNASLGGSGRPRLRRYEFTFQSGDVLWKRGFVGTGYVDAKKAAVAWAEANEATFVGERR